MHIAFAQPRAGLLGHLFLTLLLPLVLLSGCVSFVADFDPASRDRITNVSQEILGLYQELLSTPPAGRRSKLVELQPRYDQIETTLRVHRLLEESRPNNADSVEIATNLMTTFGRFRAHQLSEAPDRLATAVLMVERQELERQLVAALRGEEAKKLAIVGSGGGA